MEEDSRKRDIPVPMMPTPSTPPKFGVAEMNAVTVGSRSGGRPAWGITIDRTVPCDSLSHDWREVPEQEMTHCTKACTTDESISDDLPNGVVSIQSRQETLQ